MKRQSKRPASSHESTEEGEKLAFAEDEALAARNMEHEEAEPELDDADDDEDELASGRAGRSPGGLGEKKRRLAVDQVRALERCFETDNKLDPDRKSRIARDLGLQPRQVAVWFQNRRARWKTKTLERDFAALRARHEALRADCDALRRDKDALAAEIRELRQKLSKPEAAAKLEAAANDAAAEERQATAGASAAAVCKDGSSDSDSSVVFNDVEASPYSGAAFEQPAFAGFGAPFLDTSAAVTTGCSSLSMFETKWQQAPACPYDSYKSSGGVYGFTEEWFASSDVIGSGDCAASFFSEEHASSLNFGWCASSTEAWERARL